MLIAVAAPILFPARGKPDEADEEDENARRQRLATERDSAASAGFQTALDACRGLPARLTRIAEAAEARAAALREAHDAGLIAAPHRVSPDWRRPWELQRESPRLPVIAWQLLDRAFDQLTATLDDPDTDLHTCACAYDQLGKAACEGAKQLHNDDVGQRELSSEFGPLLVLRQARPRRPQDHHRAQPARSAMNASTSASKSSTKNSATTGALPHNERKHGFVSKRAV